MSESFVGPSVQEQGVEAGESAQIDKSGVKGQPFATMASDLLCADDETIDGTGFSSGELLLEICDEGTPVELLVKATPLLSSGSGAVVSGTSFAQACNKGVFNWTGYDEGKQYDFCDDNGLSGHLAFDRTYIVTVGSSGNGDAVKDRFYARWKNAANPDIAAIWSHDRFTDVNAPTNNHAEVIWSSSMPNKDELFRCAATVTGLDWYDTWVVEMTNGDSECQIGINGCTLDAYPIYYQLGKTTYPRVNDEIAVVVEFMEGSQCAAKVYDWE